MDVCTLNSSFTGLKVHMLYSNLYFPSQCYRKYQLKSPKSIGDIERRRHRFEKYLASFNSNCVKFTRSAEGEILRSADRVSKICLKFHEVRPTHSKFSIRKRICVNINRNRCHLLKTITKKKKKTGRFC